MTYKGKMDLIFKEEGHRYPQGLSAGDMARELDKRGWLSPLDSVLDIVDCMREYYGRPNG